MLKLHYLQVDIGKREIVGFGYNGEESYLDDVSYPFPAIRFKEDTAEISVRNEESIYSSIYVRVSCCGI